jgi:histidyl-tRNA synthetase
MDRLPGFRDFFPEPVPSKDVWSADVRNHIFDRWRAVSRRYGFREYDGPPLEPLELYTVKSGEEIVGQLYNFTDKGDRAVSLRPEMTPTLARMIGAFERNYKKPVKWFAIPQLFRYERQQKGRLREHFQFNADILGESDPSADAELIALLIDLLRSFGLTAADFVIRLSSRNAWHDFFLKHCQDDAKEYPFYQIIDKLEREDPAATDAKLAGLGFSGEQVRAFIQAGVPTPELESILKNLQARGLADYVNIDYNVIRGLAYYTGTVFEAFDRKGEFRAIAGGGRYNHLVKLITGGKVDMPAMGFGMGDVVLTELLKERNLLPKTYANVDVFCLVEDESLRNESLRLVQSAREAGLAVEYSLTPLKSDKQFKRGVELGASFTVKAEKNADGSLRARWRNVSTREETVLGLSEIPEYLQNRTGR